MFRVFLFLSFLIIFFLISMSLPVWGLMPKSQEDSETVEEAINRIVEAHNDSPEAHIGENQSLGVHRESGIVDHLAGSIVGDKLSTTQIIIKESFSSLEAWEADGEGALSHQGHYLVLGVPPGTTDSGSAITSPEAVDIENFGEKEMLLQATVKTGSLHSSDWAEFFWGSKYSDPLNGFGIKFTNTSIVPFVCWNYEKTDGDSYTLDMTTYHTIRMHLDPLAGKVNFYADGDLIGSLDIPGTGAEDFYSLGFSIHPGTDTQTHQIWALDLLIAYDP